MKKTLLTLAATLLSLTMLLGLASCGGSTTPATQPKTGAETPVEEVVKIELAGDYVIDLGELDLAGIVDENLEKALAAAGDEVPVETEQIKEFVGKLDFSKIRGGLNKLLAAVTVNFADGTAKATLDNEKLADGVLAFIGDFAKSISPDDLSSLLGEETVSALKEQLDEQGMTWESFVDALVEQYSEMLKEGIVDGMEETQEKLREAEIKFTVDGNKIILEDEKGVTTITLKRVGDDYVMEALETTEDTGDFDPNLLKGITLKKN